MSIHSCQQQLVDLHSHQRDMMLIPILERAWNDPSKSAQIWQNIWDDQTGKMLNKNKNEQQDQLPIKGSVPV